MIYMDNAATTRMSERAFEAMRPFFMEQYANAAGTYSFANASKEAVETARKQVAKVIGAKAAEIYFTSGGTESDNWALKGVAQAYAAKGKHIIISAIEHHAILHSAQALEKQGWDLTILPVDEYAMEEALKSGKVSRYITDFPNDRTAGMEGVVAIPHLGASTEESEDNCAKMAVKQVMNYLKNGNIVNSVNFPNCDMGVCAKAARVTILHKNIPNMLSQFTTVLSVEHINISDLVNRSKGDYAYTMLDLDSIPSKEAIAMLTKIEGVIRVREIDK